MNKKTLLLSIFLFLVYSFPTFSQQIAILKPAKRGQKSEAIPITKKQYEKMMQKSRSMVNVPDIKATHAGIIDTLSNPFPTQVNWGIAAGDSQASYFDPPAACYIKAIGIVGQSWGTSPLADGYNLIINKAAYGWEFDDSWWDGDAIYTKDHGVPTLLGDLMWGEFPNTVVDGQRVWTEMIWLGDEPDSEGDGFVITAVPYGVSDAYMGTECGYDNPNDSSDVYRLAKYYQAGRSGHDPQFTVRHYSLTWQVVVEFYENMPPNLDPEVYTTVLSANAKDMRCHATDVDANDSSQAGVQVVILHYRVNDGNWHTLTCDLISGTNTDGVWQATLPAEYMSPGDILTYYFSATDLAGATSISLEHSFSYFVKTTDILVFYNDDGTSYPSWILSPYYANLWRDDQGNPYQYDVWVGLTDGPLIHELIDQYQTIVQIDAYSPATMNDEVVGIWISSGSKNLFWSSQEWGWILTSGSDSTFASDDWHNMYMGIETIGPMDINYARTGRFTDRFPINPVQDDLISGPLYDFLGDSLQLYYYPNYELGFSDWADLMTPSIGATVCFTDSAEGHAMGVHKQTNGTKTAFLTFDQLCLDTRALPDYTTTDGYHWTEPNIHSVVDAALDWFFGTQQNPPDIDVNPDSFSFLTDIGDSATSNLTITNVASDGDRSLRWSLSITTVGLNYRRDRMANADVEKLNDKINSKKQKLPHLELAKGEPDPRHGEPVVDDKGGPDNFGYIWIDSDDPNGPSFDWIDVSATGTELNLGDDSYASVTLPFEFPFYGGNKTSIKISSNGYLTFGADGSDFSNDPIPNTVDPNDIICPFWEDLNPSSAGSVYYKALTDKFIVQYSNVARFASQGTYSFEVILSRSGEIKFQYFQMRGILSGATVGIENSDGTDGLEIAYNTSYVHNNLAVKILKKVQWLEAFPITGTVLPGEIDSVFVKVNATGLSAGIYQAQLAISSNDPDESLVQIPVSLVVRGECQPPCLKAADVSALEGEVSVAILLEQNPQPVDAIGFQFSFDSTKLSFNRVERGTLTRNFVYFQAYQNSGGVITVGAFDDTPIPANSSDTLAKIILAVNPSPCNQGERSSLLLSDLVDDLAGLNTCNGIFKCEPNCLLGDVNWDGDLTPGDALCAFNIFLNDGVPPNECDNPCALKAADVNCSPNGVTPGDALYIFLGYLNGSELPLPCNPMFQVASENASENGLLKFERVGDNAVGEMTFALHLQNCEEIQAFGMAIGFPDNLLEFNEIVPGEITEGWQMFGGQESVAGVIYFGGFHDEAKRLDGYGTIAYLKFKPRSKTAGVGEIWIYNLSDDLVRAKAEKYNFSTLPSGVKVISNSEIPDEYRLHQNYPNPFNLKTEIVYELPEPAQVTIDLFNTTGQRIRRLVSQQHPAGRFAIQWDGKDEAGNLVSTGVYIYRMKTPKFSSIQKLILVK